VRLQRVRSRSTDYVAASAVCVLRLLYYHAPCCIPSLPQHAGNKNEAPKTIAQRVLGTKITLIVNSRNISAFIQTLKNFQNFNLDKMISLIKSAVCHQE
jgi:hypothetical protein